ncbi:glycosyltransferase family 4 protein [Labilibaculum antarcticum]|uniref:Glycosyl transferase family 1 n=1 Tax=Labilibaculum antarcticum TaxID=1717717 RepID=A0A1Y1CQS7_9BACT|nr:glycosyltransferase family 4 protein [Labilibaculum antarcticum]BAX82630.1 glycosyl transferase family 1 [Labilibaculum antarcticum]
MRKKKIIRITTVPQSLGGLLKGQLRYMNQYFEVIGISSPGIQLQEIEKNEGVDTFEVEMTRRISPFKDLLSLWKLFQIMRVEKPDIVHTHTPKAGTLGMLAAYFARVPNRLHTVAGLPLIEAKGTKRKLLNFVEKVTYFCATKIYPNSYGLKSIIEDERFCDISKLKVIGKGSSNGIDTSYFSLDQIQDKTKVLLQKELGLFNSDCVFCFVGRIVRDKGINELINAFQQLSIKYPNCKLILVGDYEADLDPISSETLKTIQDHASILEMGWQEDVRPFFAVSDVLAFPSYREGFPNVVMQAGAMELPSIVTDINGCNEIIEDDHNGIIIPPKDIDALYKAMEELLVNQEKRKRLLSNARKMITDRYERKFVWKMLLKEYDNILYNSKSN